MDRGGESRRAAAAGGGTVAVLGANGHAGSAICRAFAAGGWHVQALSRGVRLGPALTGVDVALRSGWPASVPQEPSALLPWLAGADLVIDAAAPYPTDPFRRGAPPAAALVSAALVRQERLLDAARHIGAAFVSIGSFASLPAASRGVAGGLVSRLVRGQHPYFALKAATAAQLLSRGGRQRVMLVAPTGFLGPWDTKEPRLSLVPRLLHGDVPAAPTDVVDFIDVRDVARALHAAVERGFWGRALPLCGHSLRFDRAVADLCREAGAAAPRWRVPALSGLPAAIALERALGALGRPSPLPTLALSIVAECGAHTPTAAQQTLIGAPTPWRQTVTDSVAWAQRREPSAGHGSR